MSFHLTAENITLENGHILKARLAKFSGDYVDAVIDLNNYIGNKFGSFEWGGAAFADSADNISFNFEGDDSVPILRADLGDGSGGSVPANINLSERIGNIDGSFNYQ